MPMYEYACRGCGKKFEKLIKSMSSTDPVICPECESGDTVRQLSVFAVASEGGKTSGRSDMPMCGRCGVPGPCGMN